MSTTLSDAQPVISPGCGAYIDLPAETLDANDDGAAAAASGSVVVIAYLKAILTAAAQTLTLTGAIVPGVHAESVVTSDATNVSQDETLTIGSVVYRFRDTLAQAYDVKIGADAAATLDNLKAAINASGTPGTEYFTGTLVHPTVIATTNTNTTQKVVARVHGTAANSAATTETSAHLSWPDTTLGGGTGASEPGVAGETVTAAGKTYTFVTALSETSGAAAVVNQVLFGADSAAALDNLKSAINGTAGEGTTFSTGTVAHTTLTATTNTDTTQVVAAQTSGSAGNALATTETLTNGAWGAATLAGGYDNLVLTVGHKKATGTITYGTPTNGDMVTVNGFEYTKAAALGALQFSSITELTALINEQQDVTATDNGTTVTVTAVAFGTAGESIDLSVGAGNDGDTAVSGATLTGGTTTLTQGTDFNAQTNNNTTATNIAAAIDALTNVASSANTATATVTASATGEAGNDIDLTTSSVAAATVSGATLASGIDADSLRIDTDALETRGLHSVALQVVAASGAHTTHVISVMESMDGVNFIASSITVTGAGLAAGVTYARYVKAEVTTVEGGASTVTVRLYLS